MLNGLSKKLQKRGKNKLVPKDCRELVMSLSDIYEPRQEISNMPLSLIKDLVESQIIFDVDNQMYQVSDLNVICGISPSSDKFINKRCLQQFICLSIEDNFWP